MAKVQSFYADYAQLLRRVRIKEKELGVSNPPSVSSKKAQHNPLTSSTDTSSIDFKLKEPESRLDSKFSSQCICSLKCSLK